jgi:hypothetical protein
MGGRIRRSQTLHTSTAPVSVRVSRSWPSAHAGVVPEVFRSGAAEGANCFSTCTSSMVRDCLMAGVRWRTAAAVWLMSLAAVGVGIASYGAPDDGTHHDYCKPGTLVPQVMSQVRLTDQYPSPVVHVRLGESFATTADGGASPVVEPLVTHRGPVCQATRSAPARHLTVIFVGTHAGSTRLLTFFQHSGSAGVADGLFSATVVVGPS